MNALFPSDDLNCSFEQQNDQLPVKSVDFAELPATKFGLKGSTSSVNMSSGSFGHFLRFKPLRGRAVGHQKRALTRNTCRALPSGRCASATIDPYRFARACPVDMQADPSYRSFLYICSQPDQSRQLSLQTEAASLKLLQNFGFSPF